MTRDELLKLLHDRAEEGFDGDVEAIHSEADEALLAYLNDDEITKAFGAVPKWYA